MAQHNPTPTLTPDIPVILPPSVRAILSSDSITPDMDMAELVRYEKYITIKQGLRVEEERIEKLDEAKQAREAGIQSTKQQIAQQKLNQELCGHRKENGKTQLAGQRDHTGVVHLICQQCQKHFLGNETPSDLRPLMDMVGGPNN